MTTVQTASKHETTPPYPPTALDDLTEAILGAMRRLDDEERRVAVAIYRLLAQAAPASPEAIADLAQAPVQRVELLLDEWPGVYRDDDSAVIGFWGLALQDMPHRVEIEGREIRAWCAWDPLFIVPVLGAEARVRSLDPLTGEEISLTVSRRAVERVEPPGAVVSFLRPDEPWDESVIHTFCHFVLYFASPESGERWAADHPGTFLLPLEDAFTLGRRIAQRVFGEGDGDG